MYYHFRKSRQRYIGMGKPDGCDFCDPYNKTKRVVQETKHAFVIENRVHYDQWEMSRVLDHLMIIPRRHVHGLNELNAEERADIMDLIADYEGNKHYEVYARSPGSKTRSVPHQHTHLIKTDHRLGRGLLYLRRPHILWRLP